MRTLRVDPPGAYLRYIDIPGPEPPIVYLHGLGCASTVDYPVVATRPPLARHRALLVDFFGHGYSDAPESFGYTLEDHADSVARLVGALGIGRFVLFGHSMGGSVAITLAAVRPDLVEQLILTEANLNPGGGFISREMAVTQPHDMPALLARFLADGRMSISRWATFHAADPSALQRSAAGLVAGTVPTMKERLYALELPRAYIVGERNLPDPDVAVLESNGVRVPVVPAAGHDMAFENPGGLADRVAAQLSG